MREPGLYKTGTDKFNRIKYDGVVMDATWDNLIKAKKIHVQSDEEVFFRCFRFIQQGDLVIKSGIKLINSSAFAYCKDLTSIIIPDSIMSIGEEAFMNCSGLTSITIPDNVTTIEKRAFLNCTNLKKVELPDTLDNIGRNAFSNCGFLN